MKVTNTSTQNNCWRTRLWVTYMIISNIVLLSLCIYMAYSGVAAAAQVLPPMAWLVIGLTGAIMLSVVITFGYLASQKQYK